MIEPVALQIRSQSCWLSPARCLFWEENKTLVASGFQLGRMAGPETASSEQSSLDRLQEQILFFKAERVLLLGSFTLPENTRYLDEFFHWRSRFSSLRFTCVLSKSSPIIESLLGKIEIGIQLDELTDGPFRWVASQISAEKKEAPRPTEFMISGYQDPGYKRFDAPRQAAATPCFFLTPDHALLPAFSKPKGADLVKPGKDQLVWRCNSDTLERII